MRQNNKTIIKTERAELFRLMGKGYSYKEKTRKSSLVSLNKSEDRELVLQLIMAIGVLVMATLLVAMALLLTEGRGGDSSFSNYWNCLFWIVMSYLDNPAGICDWAVVTSGGRIVAVIVKILAVAIFAAFTGLLVALITNWYKKFIHRAKIKKHHKDLLKIFHRQYARLLSAKRNHKCYVVPSQKLLATLQVTANMELRDVVEVSNNYYGFRVKNLANMRSIEDQGVTDRFIVEHFPVNREYGCCLDRESNVTIVSPASDYSVGTGWFSYYLAHFGGFNYISKDYDSDPLHRVSYYNIEKDVEGEALQLQKTYIQDLKELCSKPNSWVIFILSSTKSKSNNDDIHLSCDQANKSNPTVHDMSMYMTVVNGLQNQLNNLRIQYPSNTFPLRKNNIIYACDLYDQVNSFTMRISSRIQKADTERLTIVDDIAGILKKLVTVSSTDISERLLKDIKDKKFKKAGTKGTEETYSSLDWINSFLAT